MNQQERAECCVVGSGPAGVACAKALLARGRQVLLVDGGVALEGARAALVERLRGSVPGTWSAEDLERLKEGTQATSKGIPLKLAYGSDFPYRECEQHLPAEYTGVGCRASLAQGGLSNVWGAAVMPYREADLKGWPIGASDLAPHYAAVLGFTGLSARQDELAELFPLYLEPAQVGRLEPSRQSAALLQRLRQNGERLSRAGIHFGEARLAVQGNRGGDGSSPQAVPAPGQQVGTSRPHPSWHGQDAPGAAGCVYCGLCMYGCPYGLIYNAADTVRELCGHPRFQYRPGVVVSRVEESSAGAVLHGYERASGTPVEVSAGRVFLAAGVIPTTRILLRSTAAYERTVWMKDSQYFLFPLLVAGSAGDVRRESLHTLSQVFVEILDEALSPFTVHLQLYSYNDLIGTAVRRALGPLARPLGFLARGLEGRLLVAQGYLHSEHSADIAVVLKRGAGGQADRLHLSAKHKPETLALVKGVMRKLLRHARHTGALPLPALLQMGEPGRGFHTGSTFPMRALPGALETDTLGRLPGWSRVHAVDATVLPSVPATTITLSVMANAHRIGCHAAGLG